MKTVERDGRQVPIIPPKEKLPTGEPNPTVAICGKCQRDIKMVEMCCCQDPECPVKPTAQLYIKHEWPESQAVMETDGAEPAMNGLSVWFCPVSAE